MWSLFEVEGANIRRKPGVSFSVLYSSNLLTLFMNNQQFPREPMQTRKNISFPCHVLYIQPYANETDCLDYPMYIIACIQSMIQYLYTVQLA